MDPAQQMFLTQLEELDNYLKRRKVKQSQKVLGRLEDIARSSIDPAVGDQMRSIIAAQRERLTSRGDRCKPSASGPTPFDR